MATFLNALILLVPALAVTLAGPIQTTSILPSDSPIEAHCCYSHPTQAGFSQDDLLRFEEYVLQTAHLTNRSRQYMEEFWNTASVTESELDADTAQYFHVSGFANASNLTAQETARLQVLLQILNYLRFLKDKNNDVCGSDRVFNGTLLKLQQSLEETCVLTNLIVDLSCDVAVSFIENQPDPAVLLTGNSSQKRMACYAALGGIQDTMELALASIHAQ